MIANPTYPQCLRYIIVLAALTCVSASSSIVEPTTTFAGSATPTHPLGVVGQSDARAKHGLRTTSDTTESMNDKNEERGLNGVSNIAESIEAGLRETGVIPAVPTAIAQGLPARSIESTEEGLRESAVILEVPTAIAQGLQSSSHESTESAVIPEVPTAIVEGLPAIKAGELIEKTDEIMPHDELVRLFTKSMGKDLKSYERNGNLFTSYQFKRWSNVVDKAYNAKAYQGLSKIAILADKAKVSTLLAIYDTKTVLCMLADGRKDQATKTIAKKLELGLLQKWDEEGNNENIMTLLTFGRVERKILKDRALEIWFYYLENKGRNPYEVFVEQFTNRFGDKKLIELLGKAEANDQTRTLATKLAKQHKKSRGIDVLHSFELLELNKEPLDTLLANPELSTWISYAKMLTPNPYEVLFLAMRKSVGDKKLNLILAATNADGTNKSIRQILLQIQKNHDDLQQIKRDFPQVKMWQKDGKSGDDVFNLLKLQGMSRTKAWNSWVAYLIFLERQKHPRDDGKIATYIFSELKSRFKSEDLAEVIATVEGVKVTEKFVAEWKCMEWQRSGRTGSDVFSHLKLRYKGTHMFETEAWNLWVAYLSFLEKQKPPKRQRNIAAITYLELKNRFGSDDLAKLINTAKGVKVTKEFAAEWERMKWYQSKRTGNNIFDLLKLQDKGTDMFETEAWSSWVAYLTFLEKQKRSKYQKNIATVIFSELESRFESEDFAKLIAKAETIETTKKFAAEWKFLKWYESKETVKDVFGILKLKDKGPDMLGTEAWSSWVGYLTFVEKKQQREDRSNIAMVIFSELRSLLNPGELPKLMANAKNVEATKELALQWDRFKWRNLRYTPLQIFEHLDLQNKGEHILETEEWRLWITYLTSLEKQNESNGEIASAMFSALKSKIKSEDLPKLIATAKGVKMTEELAAEWERMEWRIAHAGFEHTSGTK